MKQEDDYTSSKTLLLKNDPNILPSWLQHSSASHHDIPPEKAKAIRQSLLKWYFANRRKLPWRGDAPPFDGSTAGIATSSTSASTKKRKIKEEEKKRTQKTLNSFFTAAPSKKRRKAVSPKKTNESTMEQIVNVKEEEECNDGDEVKENEEALPVTGYGVWVSEIMLQQTRVEAVIPYYLKWMKSFPTVEQLASASEEDVNAHWAGLGFYRRARLLHAGAKKVMKEYNGQVPNTVEELLKIDGIGR